jgi:hypothetical protein
VRGELRATARSRVTVSSAARGSTAASTASSTIGSVCGERATSAAIARAGGTSSSASASAVHVPGSRSCSVDISAQVCDAEVTDVPRAAASSSTKNSLTPDGGSSACAQSGDAAPGSPACRASDAGRSAANDTITAASYAASCALSRCTRISSAALPPAVRVATGNSSVSRVGRTSTPSGTGQSSGIGSSGATVSPTPNPLPSNM